MTFCPKCGAQQPDGAVFCSKCGTKLHAQSQRKICPNCHSEMEPGMIFCSKCGARYNPPQPVRPDPPRPQPVPNPPQPRPRPTPVADVQTLTILSVICIFLCWPVAIYGFVCRSRAVKATSQEAANRAIHNGNRACIIGLCVIGALFVIGLLGGM